MGEFLKYLGTVSAMAGLVLVISAAVPVVLESRPLQGVVDSDLADLPELFEKDGQDPGERLVN